ncbi:MAG: hypothetical protein WCP85_08280 [Mariniphaga sp.]
MKTDIGFEEIGQKTTYKVPDGFFERVSSDTLIKAQQREQKRKTNRVIWRTMAVAASLLALLFFSYYRPEPVISDTNLVSFDGQSKLNLKVNPSESISNPILVAESTGMVIHKKLKMESSVAELSTVLAEMTDEDLQQLATMYKNDLFLGESPQ